jgi:hypothetical protein
MSDDEALLRSAERALTEIKVARGLSNEQASVLAALRLRLKGDPGTSLDDMLAAAGDLGEGKTFDDLMGADPEPSPARSLDDVLTEGKKKKPSLDDLLSSDG